MMRLIPAALCVLTFILLASPAEAGPVAAAIGFVGKAVASFAAKGWFAAFLVRTATSVALSALARALGSKARAPAAPGIKTEATTSGGTTAQKFILGHTATGGQLVAPPMSWGDPGSTPAGNLVYVVALSVVPGCTLIRTMVDDAWVPLAAPVEHWGHEVDGDFAGKITIDYRAGQQTTAHSGLMSKFATDPDRPWSADMVGPGLCYAVTRFRYSREHFNGLPQVRFEMLGIPLYDPRADSSVGGSGPQRWNDRTTWAQSANLALMIYNVMRGIDVGGGLIWGGTCAAEDLPLDNWFAAMNACDLPISTGAGGTVPQYHGGIEVALDDEPAAVIEELLKAACAQMAEIGGIWKIRVGGPSLPVYFLTDADILVSEEQRFEPFPSLSNTWNGISATHPDPDSLWETKEALPRYNPEWEAEDGGRRLVADLALPACPYPEQAQRVMVAYIADHRRQRQHDMVLKPEAAILEPLDSIGWTSSRYGYTGKVFEVSTITDHLMTLNQALRVRERDSGDFDWSPARLLPVSPAPIQTTRPASQIVPGFAVEAAIVADAASAARRPAIDLSWDADRVSAARGLLWELRLSVEAETSLSGSHADITSGQLRLVSGILPASAYWVRAALETDREPAWTGWHPVSTPDVRLGPSDLSGEITAQIDAAQDRADQAFARHDVDISQADGALAQLRGEVWGGDRDSQAQQLLLDILSTYQDRDQLRRGVVQAHTELSTVLQEGLSAEAAARQVLVAALADAAAAVAIESRVRATADTALSTLIIALTARVGGAEASITTESEARATADTATAGQIAGLTTRIGSAETNITNEATARTTADTAIGGRIDAVTTRVGNAETAITTEQTSRTNADSALAGSIGTVNSTVAGIGAIVTTQASAISDIQGNAEATYSLRLTGAGALAAFEMVASNNPSGPASSVKLKADNIRLDGNVDVTGDFLAKSVFTETAWIKRAAIADAAIDSAKIANTLQSDNFVSGPTGTGWQLNKDGSGEINNLKVRRQIAVASGNIPFSLFTPAKPASWSTLVDEETNNWAFMGRRWWLTTTPVAMTEWHGLQRTYLATAAVLGTVTSETGAAPDVWWGAEAHVMPLTRWEPGTFGQTLRLRIDFWHRKVAQVGTGQIQWKIYEVS